MSLFDFPAKMGKGDRVSAFLAIAGTNFYFLGLYGLGRLSMASSTAIPVQLIGWNASWLCHWLPFAMSSYGCHSHGPISDWCLFLIHLLFWLELLCQPTSWRCPLLDYFFSWRWMLEFLKEGWILDGETVLLDTRIGLSHLRWPDGSLLLPCTRVSSRHSMMGMLALSGSTQSPTFPLASILYQACEVVFGLPIQFRISYGKYELVHNTLSHSGCVAGTRCSGLIFPGFFFPSRKSGLHYRKVVLGTHPSLDLLNSKAYYFKLKLWWLCPAYAEGYGPVGGQLVYCEPIFLANWSGLSSLGRPWYPLPPIPGCMIHSCLILYGAYRVCYDRLPFLRGNGTSTAPSGPGLLLFTGGFKTKLFYWMSKQYDTHNFCRFGPLESSASYLYTEHTGTFIYGSGIRGNTPFLGAVCARFHLAHLAEGLLLTVTWTSLSGKAFSALKYWLNVRPYRSTPRSHDIMNAG